MHTNLTALVLAIVAATVSVADEKKSDPIKWEMAQLEQTWGIKLKSGSATEDGKRLTGTGIIGGVPDGRQIKMLLEFGKDIPDQKVAVFKALYPDPLPKVAPPGRVVFYFLDEDNVSLGQTEVWGMEGQLSGKKGDAVRIYLVPPVDTKRIRKVEARIASVEKN